MAYQRWHTFPNEPNVIVSLPGREEKMKLSTYQKDKQKYKSRPLKQIIDPNAVFFHEIQSKLAAAIDDSLYPVERKWLTLLFGSFDGSLKQVLTNDQYEPWSEDYAIRAQYKSLYKQDAGRNMSIYVVIGRLLSYNEIIKIMRNVEVTRRCTDGNYRIFFEPPKKVVEFPIDAQGDAEYNKEDSQKIVGFDPVRHWGVLEDRGTLNLKTLPGIFKCCKKPLSAQGCWISIVDGQPYGEVVRYEVMQSDYWPQISQQTLANDDFEDTFITDIQVGTAFLDLNKYVPLHKQIQEMWSRTVVQIIAKGYSDYVNLLQDDLDSYERVNSFAPSLLFSDEDREILYVFFQMIFEYNRVIDGRTQEVYTDDTLISYLDNMVFRVQAVRANFTYELRGGILLGGGGAKSVRIKPLNMNRIHNTEQIKDLINHVGVGKEHYRQELIGPIGKLLALNEKFIEEDALFTRLKNAIELVTSARLKSSLPFHTAMTSAIKMKGEQITVQRRATFEETNRKNRELMFERIQYVNRLLQRKDPAGLHLLVKGNDITEHSRRFVVAYEQDVQDIVHVIKVLNERHDYDIVMSSIDKETKQKYEDIVDTFNKTVLLTSIEKRQHLSADSKFYMFASYAPSLRAINGEIRDKLLAEYVELQQEMSRNMDEMAVAIAAYEEENLKYIAGLKRFVQADNYDGFVRQSTLLSERLVTSRFLDFKSALIIYSNVADKSDPEWKVQVLKMLNADPIDAVESHNQALLYVDKLEIEEQERISREQERIHREQERIRREQENERERIRKDEAKPKQRKIDKLALENVLREIDGANDGEKARVILESLKKTFPNANFEPFIQALHFVRDEESYLVKLNNKAHQNKVNKEHLDKISSLLIEWKVHLVKYVKDENVVNAENYIVQLRTNFILDIFKYFESEQFTSTKKLHRLSELVHIINIPFDNDLVDAAKKAGFFVRTRNGLPKNIDPDEKSITVFQSVDKYDNVYIQGVAGSPEKRKVFAKVWMSFLMYVARLGTGNAVTFKNSVIDNLKRYTSVLPVQIDHIAFQTKENGAFVNVAVIAVEPKLTKERSNLFQLETHTWNNNSCWLDAAFLILFGIPQNSISRRVFGTTVFVKEKEQVLYYVDKTKKVTRTDERFGKECTDGELRKMHASFISDIIMVQTHECQRKPLGSIHFWDVAKKCFTERKVPLKKKGSPYDALENIRDLYDMKDLISDQSMKSKLTYNNDGTIAIHVDPSRVKSKNTVIHVIHTLQGEQVDKHDFDSYSVPLQETIHGRVFRLYGIVSYGGDHFTTHLYDFKLNEWIFFNIGGEGNNGGGFKKSNKDGFPDDRINYVRNGFKVGKDVTIPIIYVYMAQEEIDTLLRLASQSEVRQDLMDIIERELEKDNYEIIDQILTSGIWTSAEDRTNLVLALHRLEMIDGDQYIFYMENTLEYIVDNNVATENFEDLFEQLNQSDKDEMSSILSRSDLSE